MTGGLPPLPHGVRRRAAPGTADPLGEGLGIGASHPTLPTPGEGYGHGPTRPHAFPGWALRVWGDLLPTPPTPDAFPAPALPTVPTVAEIARAHGARDGAGLDAETGGVDAARALAAFAHTYWSCVERGWGLPTMPRRRYVGTLTPARRKALEDAARTLTTLGVRPADWIALRFRAWQRCRLALGGRKRATGMGEAVADGAPFPAFGWVMAAASVARFAEDSREGLGYDDPPPPTGSAPPVLSGPIRGLLLAWQSARAALVSLPPGSTREDAERAVRAHVGSWPTRLAEAREALDTEARTVGALALRGEWVWPLPVNAIGLRGTAGVSVAELAAEGVPATPPPAVWAAVRDRTLPALPATPGAPTRATTRAPSVARSAATVSRPRGAIPPLPALPTLPRR